MAKTYMTESVIADYMKRNKCSREEAIDLINYDNAVEGNEETEYDLTEEQEANVKKMMRQTDHAKQDGKVKRERKPNELKEAIVEELAEFLREDALGQAYEEVQIENKNRLLSFAIGEKRFELMLIEKRPPKK